MNLEAFGRAKFDDPFLTANGQRRASVALKSLETLWFNTGTLCNITCQNCYIESSPKNDRLVYLSLADVRDYLDEIRAESLPVKMIGFTGGEPFMNRDMPAILEETLERGFEVLVLTNAMRPMMRYQKALRRLQAAHGGLLRFRVSLDDHRAEIHDAERGKGSFAKAMEGLRFLSREGFQVEIAGRRLSKEPDSLARAGYKALFQTEGVAINCDDPVQLVIFPEMSPESDPPEITEACWGILQKTPDNVMCATSRMVVRRKGEDRPKVVACTLIAYDERFEMGSTLAEASASVALNHRYCATFCVLGGAACGVTKG
ncbi:radical SAM protein [Rhabdaerophilum sp.]|uniref:radical SAM protein n=1 Tax=Rhabdaerophilum sp. TaxID=2717341 RepID=UPI0038D4274D